MTVYWTTAMIDRLRELRAAGVPLEACADHLGVGLRTCRDKCRQLGLSARASKGRKAGTIVVAEAGSDV